MDVRVFGDFMIDVVDSSARLGGAATAVRCLVSYGIEVQSHGYLEHSAQDLSGRVTADETTWAHGDGEVRVRFVEHDNRGSRVVGRIDRRLGDARHRIAGLLGRGDARVPIVISDFGKSPIGLVDELPARDVLVVGAKRGYGRTAPGAPLVTSAEDRGLSNRDDFRCGRWISAAARIRRGPVILTMGDAGALICSDGQTEHIAAPTSAGPRWTIGAGDWLLGSLAASLLENRPLKEATERAVADASESTSLKQVGG